MSETEAPEVQEQVEDQPSVPDTATEQDVPSQESPVGETTADTSEPPAAAEAQPEAQEPAEPAEKEAEKEGEEEAAKKEEEQPTTEEEKPAEDKPAEPAEDEPKAEEEAAEKEPEVEEEKKEVRKSPCAQTGLSPMINLELSAVSFFCKGPLFPTM